MRRYQFVQTLCGVSFLAFTWTLPAEAASPESKHSTQSGAAQGGSTSTMPAPKDCSQIKSGTADNTAQSAAQKDCERSQHLGAGTGTSSGTGSGKMPPGSGSR